MNPPRSVAVIGAGWAGCAAAATLAEAGLRVSLLEAAEELGGRARAVELELDGLRHRLDNGQHLMIGAYTEIAGLLRRIGVALDDVVERRPFELAYADGFRLRASRLPAPWHLATALIGARGLSFADRTNLVRLLRRLKAGGWRVSPDHDAASWLAGHGQGATLVTRVWRPLALAALNTPLQEASAQLLANVLRDSLGAHGDASMLWLPRVDLSALLPRAVERFVLAHGGDVLRGSRVEAIVPHGSRFRLRGVPGTPERTVDAVVYAAPPSQLPRVGHAFGERLAVPLDMVARFAYEPISTVYLKYAPETMVPRGFLALLDDPARRAYGQWVFDRGALDPAQRGVVSVVISAGGPHQEESIASLSDAVARQLGRELGLPAPRDGRVITEKRATLAARPGLRRPGNVTDVRGLVLAGDWTDSDYPSTLEAAVRSGVAAATRLLG